MDKLQPRMTPNEINLFNSLLKSCKGSYFEFGGGGSTYHACMYPNIHSITTVESDKKWIDKLKVNDLIATQSNKIKFIYIDINADNSAWSIPKDNSKRENFPQYSKAIKSNGQIYDLVLIDGRFRVACALHTLGVINDQSVVLIHDYKIRPQYQVIEQFYNIVSCVDTLYVFKKKPIYDSKLLDSMIKTYEYNYK